MIATERFLGHGIYSIRQAALFAKLKTARLQSWMFGEKRLFDPEYGEDELKVSFLDLIQAVVIRNLKVKHKVSSKKFRKAIRIAKNKYDLDKPFAMNNSIFWNSDAEDLVIRPPGQSDDLFVQVSGKQAMQLFVPCEELYMQYIDYAENGLAKAYRPFEHNGITILQRPGIAFGAPLLPSGYTAITIAKAVVIEGGKQEVVDGYMLPMEEVEAAYKYRYEYLRSSQSA